MQETQYQWAEQEKIISQANIARVFSTDIDGQRAMKMDMTI